VVIVGAEAFFEIENGYLAYNAVGPAEFYRILPPALAVAPGQNHSQLWNWVLIFQVNGKLEAY
jgi:hypothetical protein